MQANMDYGDKVFHLTTAVLSWLKAIKRNGDIINQFKGREM
jgi:hypothetical protein